MLVKVNHQSTEGSPNTFFCTHLDFSNTHSRWGPSGGSGIQGWGVGQAVSAGR